MTTTTYVIQEMGVWPEVSEGFLYGSLVGIANANSTKQVDVRSISVTQPMSSDATSAVGLSNQQLVRISAFSGGIDLTPIKSDTNAATLSGVTARRFAGVTTTGIALRQFAARFGQRVTNAATPIIYESRLVGRTASAASWAGAAAGGGIVLREGEGFAWLQKDNHAPKTQEGMFVVRVVGTGASYVYRVVDVPAADQDVPFMLFNNVGSGLVLEVRTADICDIGLQARSISAPYANELTTLPVGFRLVRGRGITGGRNANYYARDTAASALPSGISCLRGGTLLVDGPGRSSYQSRIDGSGAPPSNGPILFYQQNAGLERGFLFDLFAPVVAGGTHQFRFGVQRDLARCRTNQSLGGYTLDSGEALALVLFYISQNPEDSTYTLGYDVAPNTGYKFNVEMEFTVGPATSKSYAPTSVAMPVIS